VKTSARFEANECRGFGVEQGDGGRSVTAAERCDGAVRLSAELWGEKIRMFQAMHVAVLVFAVPNFGLQK
jgi:hypothetical protein